MKCFRNVRAYIEGEGIVEGSLNFDETIRDTTHASGEEIILPSGALVLPGFLDPHIHGAGGCDAMDGTEESLDTIGTTLAAEGTTGFLATTMTQSEEAILRALSAVRTYRGGGGARLLGVHLEGPFLSPAYAGAQPAEYLVPPDTALFDRYQTASGGKIRIVTVAPDRAMIRHHIDAFGVE